jgi:hypothetical protein
MCPLGEIHYVFVAMSTVACWRKEHLIENILYTFFFCMLSKWETRPHIARLPFPICETRLISTRVSHLLALHVLEV